MIRSRLSGRATRRAPVASSSAFPSTSVRPSPAPRRRSFGPVEGLERRTLLAAFVVTDAGDSGPGTLRQAILDANTSTGADTITFNLPGPDAVRTIRPLSALPEITGQTTIDGGTQAGVLVQLDGSLAGVGANGLKVTGSNSLIRRLVVNRFSGHGVVLGVFPPEVRTPQPTALRLELSLIGTDAFGNVGQGNGGAGVVVTAANSIVGTPQNTIASIGRNVISGNGGPGVWVAQGAISPTFPGPGIFGNYIGTNAAGSRALGNGREGVLIEAGSNTTVGNTAPATRNVISGNAASGVRIAAPAAGAVIQNNLIGTNFAGSGAIPNGWSDLLPYGDGITVAAQTGAVRIGGPQPPTATSSVRNVISGNFGNGVLVESGTDVQVVGNFVGTDATGNADLGNRGHGIAVAGVTEGPAQQPMARVTGNLLSGNGGDGVLVGLNSRVMALGGNYVGTNATGTAALGNDGNGVTILGTINPTTIGAQGPLPIPLPGTTPPPPISPAGTTRNLISANGGHGIVLAATGARTTLMRTVVNNFVGTDISGTVPLGNGGSGVHILNGFISSNITVGGTGGAGGTGSGNLISANGGNGITVVGPPNPIPGPASNVVIVGNRIGAAAPDGRIPPPPLDPGANAGLGNRGHGVAVFNSIGTRVGGGAVDTGNIIAYNDGAGVLVEGGPGSTSGPTTGVTSPTIVTANSIYGNGGLGIDLSMYGEGVTPNDPRDADTGPNGLLNHPTVTEAVSNVTGSSVQIRYVLMAEPSRTYRVEFFSSPLPDPSGRGEGRNYLGFANVSTDSSGTSTGTGTFTATSVPAGGLYITATATVQGGLGYTSEFSPAVRVTPPPPLPPIGPAGSSVVARHVFYNNSVYDVDEPANPIDEDGPGDDAAIAPDKEALLPGQTASFENVTSYRKGINGVMLDLQDLPAGAETSLGPEDFEVFGGRGNAAWQWGIGPRVWRVTVRRGAGVDGSDRVTLYWADYNPAADSDHMAVINGWVRVTVLAGADTGLAAPDVFYFGNLIGESGDNGGAAPLRVNATDIARLKGALGRPAPITSPFDHNRDGTVNAEDLAATKQSLGLSLNTPVPPGPAPAAEEADAAGASITQEVLG